MIKSEIHSEAKMLAIHHPRSWPISALHGMLKFFSFLATHGHQLPQIRQPPKPTVPGPRQWQNSPTETPCLFRRQCDNVVLNCFSAFPSCFFEVVGGLFIGLDV